VTGEVGAQRAPDDPREVLAGELRRLQVRAGKSLRELARSTMSSDSALSRYFSGRVVPPWSVVQALCGTGEGDLEELRTLWNRARSARISELAGPNTLAGSAASAAPIPDAGPESAIETDAATGHGASDTVATPEPVPQPATQRPATTATAGVATVVSLRPGRSRVAVTALAFALVGLLVGWLIWQSDRSRSTGEPNVGSNAGASTMPTSHGSTPTGVTPPEASPSPNATPVSPAVSRGQPGGPPMPRVSFANASPSTSVPRGSTPTSPPPTVAPLPERYLLRAGTGECLAADYSAVYMISCAEAPAKAQTWRRVPIDGGKYKLEGGTGKCLSNFDWDHVWTIDCGSSDPGLIWSWDTNSRLWNTHTGRSLVADFAHNVALYAGDGAGQFWLLA
jgi:transcriptional regulator with XRE-family HTH domain